MCKEIGLAQSADGHASLKSNPIAVELGLDDPNGPWGILAQAKQGSGPNVMYQYLLDACDKMFDSELDQATFEEHMRWFFGNKVGPIRYHKQSTDGIDRRITRLQLTK